MGRLNYATHVVALLTMMGMGTADAAPNLDVLLGPPGSSADFDFVWDGFRGTLRLPRPSNLTSITPRPNGRLPTSSNGVLTDSSGRTFKVTYWLGGAGESVCIQAGTCLQPWGIERGRDWFGQLTNKVIPGGIGFSKRGNDLMHRITLLIDFSGTPNNLLDDQKFDGYVHTQSSRGFSGITWWSDIPFAFSASKRIPPPPPNP